MKMRPGKKTPKKTLRGFANGEPLPAEILITENVFTRFVNSRADTSCSFVASVSGAPKKPVPCVLREPVYI